jgi:hypothetical protein
VKLKTGFQVRYSWIREPLICYNLQQAYLGSVTIGVTPLPGSSLIWMRAHVRGARCWGARWRISTFSFVSIDHFMKAEIYVRH